MHLFLVRGKALQDSGERQARGHGASQRARLLTRRRGPTGLRCLLALVVPVTGFTAERRNGVPGGTVPGGSAVSGSCGIVLSACRRARRWRTSSLRFLRNHLYPVAVSKGVSWRQARLRGHRCRNGGRCRESAASFDLRGGMSDRHWRRNGQLAAGCFRH